MSFDAHSWIVRRRRVSFPKNARVYSCTREQLPMEMDLPEIGTDAATILGSAFTGYVVTDSGDNPSGAKRNAYFEIAQVPSGVFTEYESMGYTFPPIYPASGLTNFPGGSAARPRVVLAKVEYEFSRTPSAWEADASIGTGLTDGPFQPKSVLAFASSQDYEGSNGSYYKVGQWLEGYFISQDTLNNAMDINIPGELFYAISASTPSASTYDGWVTAKSFFIADRSVSKWRGDIYVRVTRKVRAQ